MSSPRAALRRREDPPQCVEDALADFGEETTPTSLPLRRRTAGRVPGLKSSGRKDVEDDRATREAIARTPALPNLGQTRLPELKSEADEPSSPALLLSATLTLTAAQRNGLPRPFH